MKVPLHIRRLYSRTARRYKKLLNKLNRAGLSAYQRRTFADQIRKLVRRLRELEAQLRIAAAGGAVVLMLNATPAKAQDAGDLPFSTLGPFVQQDRENNPLREPLIHERMPALATIDYDGDGDFDIVLGEYTYYDGWGGRLRYYENLSSDGNPLFVERKGEDNPFYEIRGTTYGAAPAFGDVDGDGDLDLILGHYGWPVGEDYYESHGIEYYRNDDGVYSKQTGSWDDQTKEGNPFDFISLGEVVRPVLVDFDHDGDVDLLVGSSFDTPINEYPYYERRYLQYYRNDGKGNFTPVDWTLDAVPGAYYYDSVTPALADLDGDGDYDLIVGNYYDEKLSYYIQVSENTFELQYGEWDPETKSGNPFENFRVATHPSSVFMDFNNDGLLDLFVADQSGYYKYSDNIVNYYENTGESVFVEKTDMENPFHGVYVMGNASPLLVDLDGDGDLDALVGNKYSDGHYDYETGEWIYVDSSIAYYENEDGIFRRMYDEEDPFDGKELYGTFSPDMADLDGDGDTDMISATGDGYVTYFKNDEGVFNEEGYESSPFAEIRHAYYTAARLVDMDGDDDFDLVMSNDYGEIFLHTNTGDVLTPKFAPTADAVSPLDTLSDYAWSTPFIHFVDLDHDGDRDVLFNGTSPDDGTTGIFFGENVGSRDAVLYRNFVASGIENVTRDQGSYANATMADIDGDGDLDIFVGNSNGTVSYFENQNEIVAVAVSDTPVQYTNGGDPVPVAPELTLTDPDNDQIVQATVTILDYTPSEMLSFTPRKGINGVFDASTGILTFRGKSTVASYQALLRSVAFKVTYDEEGRQRAPKNTIVGKTISFEVFDIDFTLPEAAEKTLEIFVNDDPSVNAHTVKIVTGQSAVLDLKTIVSDPNGAADIALNSLKVITEPSSGAETSIDANGILTIDYAGLGFQGTESMVVEVCDLAGACGQNTLTLVVSNTPPVIDPDPITTPSGTTKTLDLLTITSDVDGNLDTEGFQIVSQPTSGAVASIQLLQSKVILTLNYEGISFRGTDKLTIRACDHAGACVERVLQVVVDVDDAPTITVYNAVAPNSTGDNKYMRISGLPGEHKVTIFSRWGDKVFETDNYNAVGGSNVFKGLNNNGTALSSGTYFYTIEVPGKEMITGYITLKQ